MTAKSLAGLLICLTLAAGCSSDSTTSPLIPVGIRITSGPAVLGQGLTLQLKADVIDSANNPIPGDRPTFLVQDTTLVKVSASGLVHSVGGLGTTRIVVSFDHFAQFVQVHVRPRVATLGITIDSLRINRYDVYPVTLAVRDSSGALITDPSLVVNAVSSDTNILAIEVGHDLDAKNVSGHVTVTFSADLVQVVLPVFVTQIPDSILLTPANVILASGETQQTHAAVIDRHRDTIPGQLFAYDLTASAVASVSAGGLVTSLGPNGSAIGHVQSDSLSIPFSVFVGDSSPGVVVQSTRTGGDTYAAAVTVDGKVLVSQNDLNAARLGQLPDYGMPTAVTGLGQSSLGVAVNHAGTRGYVATVGSVGVIDLTTNTRLADLADPLRGQRVCLAVSKDDQHLYVGTTEALYDIDLATGHPVDSLFSPTGDAYFALALDTVHARLYASLIQATVIVEYTLGTSMVEARRLGTISESRDLAVSADGTELYATAEGGHTLTVWNLASGDSIQSVHLDAPGGGFGVAVSANRIAVTVERPGAVQLYDRTTRALLKSIPVSGAPGRPAWNAAGTILVVPEQNGSVDFIR